MNRFNHRAQPRTTRWMRLASALTLTILLAGTSRAAGSAPAAPVKGGTLTMARSTDIFTFDPYNTQDDNSIFTEATIFDGLVRLGPDGKSVIPALATAWHASKDGKAMTFTLRPGVRFSDGTPLTSRDVAWSLQRDADPKGSWGFLFAPVTSVTADSANAVTIHMSSPFAPLLPALTTFAASIYSKKVYDKYGRTGFGQHPLGTGPFMLKQWNKGVNLELVRNPYYWEAGKPYLDGVTFTVVGDDNTKILQLQSGQADIIDRVPPNLLAQLRTNPKVSIESVKGTAVGWITINEAVKPLGDVNVRRALAWALDRQSIARNVYFGVATPAKSVVPSSTFYYDPNTNPIGYDLAKAKQFLAKSSAPHGFSVQIMVPSGDAAELGIATIWSSALKQIGINASILQVEATTAQDRYNSEKYQIWISQWTNDTPDPDEFAGAGLDYKAGQNSLHTGFKNDQMSALVEQARQQLNPQKRAQMYSEIQRLVNDYVPFIYVDEVPRLYASASSVHGFLPNSQGKYGFQNVWIQR
ncbi:MAG TPA: ABC transporter substrate-binding protein [Chloroflexota bacterium]|nr:ABC transporter substrate-binding protein [Chloroflexota bacterium]